MTIRLSVSSRVPRNSERGLNKTSGIRERAAHRSVIQRRKQKKTRASQAFK